MKIKAVIFDWAGTTVDFGCFAPVDAFVQAFAAKEINITMDEVRKPMGMLKRDHIKAILNEPRVYQLWVEKHGKPYSKKDIDEIHDTFEAHILTSLLKHNTLMTGLLDTITTLKDWGLRIGSTTGYTKKMMDIVQKDAADHGYKPDSIVTPDDVGYGRPYPYMIHKNMQNLEVFPPQAIIKVGDTESDILEGLNAGIISVGVIVGSSMLGLTEEEYKSLSKDQRKYARNKAEHRFFKAGATHVIKDITKLPKLINKLNRKG